MDAVASGIGWAVVLLAAVFFAALLLEICIGFVRSVSFHLWAVFYVKAAARPIHWANVLQSLFRRTLDLAHFRHPGPVRCADPKTGTVWGVWYGTFKWTRNARP